MSKYTTGKNKSGYFCGGNNNNFSPIMCENKNFMPLTPQSYILN